MEILALTVNTSDKQVIMVFNAGSSSLKFSIFKALDLSLMFKGQIVEVNNNKTDLKITDHLGNQVYNKIIKDYFVEFNLITDWLLSLKDKLEIIAIGHRVVHGALIYTNSVLINQKVIKKLERLSSLAPLHLPSNIFLIKRSIQTFPNIPQIACFDTEFHHTMPEINRIFALPQKYQDIGIIRYGFHGLSYEYIADIFPKYDANSKNIMVLHLGSGASICAMQNLKSIATTMGYTPLDGLVMGTRTGSIDPGIIFHLLQVHRVRINKLMEEFYFDSGLKGVSNLSGNIKELIESDNEKAKFAVELFCSEAAKHLASLLPALGSLDAIVFTAGIGENSPIIREKICNYLKFLGLEIDLSQNQNNSLKISTENSKISAYVIKTNEEIIVAQKTLRLINAEKK